MPKIINVRPVLLSAPYAYPEYLEVKMNLKSGLRTSGLVEIILDDGTTGLGEGYLAVFAPHVFEEIVKLVTPYLIDKDIENIDAIYSELCTVTGYWSLQGAARHVVSACEIALIDAKAKHLNVPAYSLFGKNTRCSIKLYGSGGDSGTPLEMSSELERLKPTGIDVFKIRAQNFEVAKTVWTLEKAAEMGINIAVDMCQNLASPAQAVNDVLRYLNNVHTRTDRRVVFLEEALGPMDIDDYPVLRSKVDLQICGGEIITTPAEMCRRVRDNIYDFVQPDATVIGGIGQVLEVFRACKQHNSCAVVHCWGSGVCVMANYHAAFAGGGELAEWPMPEYPLRGELLVEQLQIKNGNLKRPKEPGLGVRLTKEIEERYAFKEEALYTCLEDSALLGPENIWEVSY